MKVSTVFIVCFLLGAFSWAICTLFFDTFEPFDAGGGFYIGQISMLLFMVYVGWTTSFKHIIVGTAGLYLSQNSYAYLLGSGDQKAWALLLLITSLSLCILPFLGGAFARGVKIGYSKYSQNN